MIQSDEDDRPITSYGLGVFVPSFRSSNVQTFSEVSADEIPGTACGTVTYSRSLSDRTFMLGGAVAHRVDDVWSLGLTMFGTYRTMRESEDVACSAGPNRFSTASTNVSLAVSNLLLRFGIKGRFGDRWRFGATLSTPSIRLLDVATVAVSRGSALAEGEPPEFFAREVTGLQADSRRSVELRVGGAYIIPKTATFTVDATFNAGTSYELFRLPAGEEAVTAAITTARTVVRNPVVNLNAGAEYLFVREFSLSAGLFTNFSTAPDIEGRIGQTFTGDRLPQVHAAGGSLVLGFFGDYTLTRVGFTLSYGEGTDVVPRVPGLAALGQPDEFVKVGLSQLFAFFFISSTFRY